MFTRLSLFILLSLPFSANATFVVITDTATDFNGTFSITLDEFETVFPTSFIGLLPFDPSFGAEGLFAERIPDAPPFPGEVSFGSIGFGNPDDPFISGLTGDTLPSVSGSFSNNASGTLVYFILDNFVNTPGPDGIFSGNFAFSTSTLAPVPLPAAAWLFLTALCGGFGLRKLQRA